MPAPSLHHLATKASIKQIREVKDLGDAPFSAVREILLKITNPDQLKLIEENSPQLRGQTSEVWRAMIKRNLFLTDEQIKPPMNPKNWSGLYTQLKANADAKRARAEAALTNQLFAHNEGKKAQEVQFDNTLTVPTKKRKTKAWTSETLCPGPMPDHLKVTKEKPKPKNVPIRQKNGKIKMMSSTELMDMYRQQANANKRFFAGSAIDMHHNLAVNPRTGRKYLKPDIRRLYPGCP